MSFRHGQWSLGTQQLVHDNSGLVELEQGHARFIPQILCLLRLGACLRQLFLQGLLRTLRFLLLPLRGDERLLQLHLFTLQVLTLQLELHVLIVQLVKLCILALKLCLGCTIQLLCLYLLSYCHAQSRIKFGGDFVGETFLLTSDEFLECVVTLLEVL